MKGLKRKDLFLVANKLIEKVPDPRYESFLRKKSRKSVKQSEVITYKPEAFDTVDAKSDITKHPEISQKLSKTIKKGEKVMQKACKFFDQENVKTTNREHAFKGYASTYNAEIFNSFNHELQLKDSGSAIKSKLIESLPKLRGFKFVTTWVLVLKKIESKDKTKYDNYYSSSNAEIIINESDTENMFK